MAATSTKARHKLTLEAFLELPEVKPALEYFGGVVRQKVAPLGAHSILQSGMAVYLDELIRPGGTGRVFTELRATFAGQSVVPDISVYRTVRIPRTPAGRVASRFRIPPDIAVEIRSPSQTLRQLADRCAWYVANGVQLALLLDARDETIRVFRPGRPPTITRAGDRVDLGDIIPGAALAVTEVFAALIVGPPRA